jgi:hypothetical protein
MRMSASFFNSKSTVLAIIILSAIVIAIIPVVFVTGETIEEQRTRLQAELDAIEKDIENKRGVLSEKQAERTSLERDVAILDTQISKAQLQIRYRDITLGQLGSDISSKESAINDLDAKVIREKGSLSQLLRRTREIDDMTLVELALGGSLSDLFEDIDNFEAIQRSLDVSFQEIASLRDDLSSRKEVLQERHEEEEDLRQIQVLEKKAIERREAEKQEILDVTKGQEKVYLAVIAEREKSATEIRTALFALRGTAAIPFGDAVEFAKAAGAKTGVRPALILGVIAQESNLGENVGQCLVTNSPNKGDGKGVNTGRFFAGVMKSTRDVDPFMQIVSELGINPSSQVVSCPPSYGYGGAMGPAQFIPSTWMLYKDRIGKAVGYNPPNPWDPETAFFATSLLMMDNGADGGTRASERLAALRYFAGWKNAKKASYAFYGDGVMELADKFQRQIDILERN